MSNIINILKRQKGILFLCILCLVFFLLTVNIVFADDWEEEGITCICEVLRENDDGSCSSDRLADNFWTAIGGSHSDLESCNKNASDIFLGYKCKRCNLEYCSMPEGGEDYEPNRQCIKLEATLVKPTEGITENNPIKILYPGSDVKDVQASGSAILHPMEIISKTSDSLAFSDIKVEKSGDSSYLNAKVTFDSSKANLGLVETPFVIKDHYGFEWVFTLYYMVSIDCFKEIDQEDCTKDQSQPKQVACKQKCEARSFCKYVYGKCKFDADVNDQERAQLGQDAVMNRLKEEYAMPGYKGPIPTCAFSGTCRNTNDFLSLFLKFSKTVFAFIAAFAFAFFVYGGFMIIISFGNAEKVKKGQQILGAAVVGLIIVFGAYMIINFLMEALSIRADFRGF